MFVARIVSVPPARCPSVHERAAGHMEQKLLGKNVDNKRDEVSGLSTGIWSPAADSLVSLSLSYSSSLPDTQVLIILFNIVTSVRSTFSRSLQGFCSGFDMLLIISPLMLFDFRFCVVD